MKNYKLKINGQDFEAKILKYDGSTARVSVNGFEYSIDIDTDGTPQAPKLVRSEKAASTAAAIAEPIKPKQISPLAPASAGGITAPIPGLVMDVKVKPGDNVAVDDVIVVLEAMKMESDITSHLAGKVTNVLVHKGDTVQEGQLLVEIGA